MEKKSDTQHAFYRDVIDTLQEHHIKFMIGGAYAFKKYTGIYRDTKDLDIFCLQSDIKKILTVLKDKGYTTEMTDKRWIAKAFYGDAYADFIFNSNNGLSPVDESWFTRAPMGKVIDRDVLLMPAEEMIWTKVYVCERDRFDGADINHLFLKYGDAIDWKHLYRLLESHWEVLLIHLLFFRFIYPGEGDRIPLWLLDTLKKKLQEKPVQTDQKICNGTLFSPTQYEIDVNEWGYTDGRTL